MGTILVYYWCWGCEAVRVVEEETETGGNIGCREIDRWNLCPDCIKRAKEKWGQTQQNSNRLGCADNEDSSLQKGEK